jgi:ABC-type multidrug transport system fused ATPase/permease subunit
MVTRYCAHQAFNGSRLLNIYWGVGMVAEGKLAPTSLLMAVVNLQVVIQASRTLFNLLPPLFLVMEPLERLASLLEHRPVIEPPPESYDQLIDGGAGAAGRSSTGGGSADSGGGRGRRPERYEGHFVFEDVHFAYPTEKQKPVLRGLSFSVLPGQKVALVGKAGCGKSTAITLVQRFYDASQGCVSLDGHPLSTFDLHHLRAHTGVVAQDNVLFSASLRDNITYGMGQNGLPEATEAMVSAACTAANCVEFIAEFPNGLATMVGEKGVKLSGGQKQRIAIARAIIRSPSILLLDEATSALDSVNEKEVQRVSARAHTHAWLA